MFGIKFKFDIYFFLVALILAGSFFLLFLDNFKTYSSEVRILVLAKDEKTASQIEVISENLSLLAQMESVRESVMKKNELLKEEVTKLADNDRKNFWNKKVSAKKISGSSVILLSAFDNNKNQSNELVRQTTVALLEKISSYYNIKTSLDLRIIDGPVSKASAISWPWLLAISIALGVVLSLFVQVLLAFLEKFLKRKLSIAKPQIPILRLPKFPKIIPGEKEKISPPPPPFGISKTATKKHPAPENLPVAPANLPTGEMTGMFTGAEEREKKDSDILPQYGEPSDEEYKERLNQLLRGDL